MEEWRKLLRAADPRFELMNINRAPKKPNTILEVAWTGQDRTSGDSIEGLALKVSGWETF